PPEGRPPPHQGPHRDGPHGRARQDDRGLALDHILALRVGGAEPALHRLKMGAARLGRPARHGLRVRTPDVAASAVTGPLGMRALSAGGEPCNAAAAAPPGSVPGESVPAPSAAGAAGAGGAGGAQPGATEVLSDRRTVSHWAYPVSEAPVRATPSRHARRV